MARQIERAGVRARVAMVTAAGAVGFAVFYFFHPEHGPRRRREAFTWLQLTGQTAWERSQRILSADDQASAPRSAEPREGDLADTLRREVEFVTVEAQPPVEEEVPVTVGAGEPPPRDPAGTSAGGGIASSEATVSFLHTERARPAKIISYDSGVSPPELADERPADPEPEADMERPSRVRIAMAVLVAGVLGLAVATLGAWALWPGDDNGGGGEPLSGSAAAGAIELISQPGAKSVAVDGSKGTMVLVVAPNGQAVLIVSGLTKAPPGKEYQAWVVTGNKPRSAGLFEGGETRLVIPLTQRVPKGAVVAVTVERAGGAPAPTQEPRFVAKYS